MKTQAYVLAVLVDLPCLLALRFVVGGGFSVLKHVEPSHSLPTALLDTSPRKGLALCAREGCSLQTCVHVWFISFFMWICL